MIYYQAGYSLVEILWYKKPFYYYRPRFWSYNPCILQAVAIDHWQVIDNNIRMWGIDPKLMCTYHLVKEHRDLHYLANLDKLNPILIMYRCFTTHNINKRHAELVKEMNKRWIFCNKKFKYKGERIGIIDVKYNIKDLKSRCPHCHRRMRYASE